MIGDASQDVGKPFTRVDAVQFAGLDQRVDGGCALTSAVGAAEGPVASANRDPPQGSFGCIVRQADAAIVEEARERAPPFQAIIDRFRNRAFR